ncbi:MAG TPA: L,D-transpeptidase [Xanthobacteraceae bacterium]|nr:L,D-transpeptidase [Xanthobacteraceae bacterium]
MSAPGTAPVRYAQAGRGQMGGGLIEFLFSDADDPPPAPRGHRGRRQDAPFYPASRYPASPYPASGYPASPYYEVYPTARAAYPHYVRGEPAELSMPQRMEVDPKYRRQIVEYDGKEPPGTIIIDTPNRFLYLVQPGGRAIRYGIGVGRPGFTWAGVKTVSSKREWPDWRPPEEMLKRRPDLPRYMPGGPDNPLGARALYLGSSLYRIHGSNEPWTIGQAVSSGCIRMRNEDVTDLYERVKVGTRVIVI